MITIANPIYDTVFKYLMEDERIARTILSALLKEDIVHVEVRPHEYSNGQKESLSIFRIDFGATVRKPDGEEQLILIELQKTWLPTETLRFRQYLGVHYQNPKNIVKDSPDRHAIPMVAVYLLGHTVGQISEPVVYVRHEVLDYNNRPVTKGIPDRFVDSLQHDSIIVQIPLLHGKINNRLDKVLSIFDQTNVCDDDQHYLSLEEEAFDDADADMRPILRRLLMAASSVEMRQNMNVEDEYFSIIKEQEGKLYGLEKEMAENVVMLSKAKAQLNVMGAQLNEKNAQLNEKNAQLNEKDAQLNEKNAQLNEKDAQLNEKDAQLNEKDAQLNEKDAQLNEKDAQLRISVKLLVEAGLPIDSIAQQLNISKEYARTILQESGGPSL